MPHPDVNNGTYAMVETIPMLDEHGQMLVVAIAKATFGFDAQGRVFRTERQKPVQLTPEYYGDPADSSLRFDVDTALEKPATDVVLIGKARSNKGPVESLDVGVRVGPVQKVARVFGDRTWLLDGGTVLLSRAKEFEEMPLVYERTFGGWDRSDEDPRKHSYEPRNPVGTGAGRPLRSNGETLKAPNIVEPNDRKASYGAGTPVGFGFVAPDWAPRAGLAGTYDASWEQTRKPLLPGDFSRRFFNAASEGLVASGYLRGDELVTLVNLGSAAKIEFALPGVAPPEITLAFRSGGSAVISGPLDTVLIDTETMTVSLVWRASTRVPSGMHDIVAIDVRFQIPALRSEAAMG